MALTARLKPCPFKANSNCATTEKARGCSAPFSNLYLYYINSDPPRPTGFASLFSAPIQGLMGKEFGWGRFGRLVAPAAKAAIDFAAVAARLKPCPFKANSNCPTTGFPFSLQRLGRLRAWPGGSGSRGRRRGRQLVRWRQKPSRVSLGWDGRMRPSLHVPW